MAEAKTTEVLMTSEQLSTDVPVTYIYFLSIVIGFSVLRVYPQTDRKGAFESW